MAIASRNVNSLHSRLDEVRLLVSSLGIHILALNETELDGSIPKELTEISGHQQKRLDRSRNGGGVSLYVKDILKMAARDDIPSDGLELLCVEVSPPKRKPFLVVAWYRPPSDPFDSFSKLEKALAYLDKNGKGIIFLCDTNCDLAKNSQGRPLDNNAKHICDIYELFIFRQLIEEPTRVTLDTVFIIDHIAITSARNIVKSGVHEVSLSDHYVVYCIRKYNGAAEKDHKIVKTHKMKNVDERAFLSDVSGICWQRMLDETDDVNVLVNRWTNLLSLIVNKHALLTEMRVSEKYCPWIDKNLQILM